MSTVTVQGLREQVRGQTITPGDSDYDEARRVYNAMIDRHPNVVVRASGTDDVVAAVNYARENGLDVAIRGGSHSVPGFGTGEDAVVIDLKGMQQVEVDAGPQDRAGAGRCDVGRLQRRHPRARPRHHRRHHLHDRRRRAHARRRHRLPLPRPRALLRQPARGRGRDRGRQRRGGHRARERRPVLGAARRRRQLRRRHGARVRRAPGERDLRRPDVLRALRRRRRAALVPRVHQGRRRAARRLPGVADRPAAPVHPRGPARRAVHGVRLVLGRAARGGRGGAEVAARRRAADRRARRPDALPGAQQRVRRAGPARACSTTGRRTSSRSSPTTRSPRTSSTGRRCRRSTRPCTSTRSTARATAWGRATPRSPTATRRSRR